MCIVRPLVEICCSMRFKMVYLLRKRIVYTFITFGDCFTCFSANAVVLCSY